MVNTAETQSPIPAKRPLWRTLVGSLEIALGALLLWLVFNPEDPIREYTGAALGFGLSLLLLPLPLVLLKSGWLVLKQKPYGKVIRLAMGLIVLAGVIEWGLRALVEPIFEVIFKDTYLFSFLYTLLMASIYVSIWILSIRSLFESGKK